MAIKKFRNMKVYEQAGYNYKSTPTIMLKGQWLREAGFDCGTSITVRCEEILEEIAKLNGADTETCGHDVHGVKSQDAIGKEYGMTGRNIARYIG